MQDYLNWQSGITLAVVFGSGESFSYPHLFEDHYLYLSSIKEEGSRNALMMRSLSGGEARCLTPRTFNLRTKFSEYGGRPFWLIGNRVYFCNQRDQCLYVQHLSAEGASEPRRVSVEPSENCVFMYTNVHELNERTLLAIVEREDPSDHDSENSSAIAMIDLDQPDKLPSILQEGADFYSNLVTTADRTQIAWVEWDHPNMPWDANRVFQAEFEESQGSETPKITNVTPVNFEQTACACQLYYANNKRLFLSADFSNQSASSKNYWNIYCVSGINEKPRVVTDFELEFGYPHWQYDDARITQYDAQKLIAIGSTPSGDKLITIDQDTLDIEFVDWDSTTVQHLHALGESIGEQGRGVCIHLAADSAPCLIEFNGNSLTRRTLLSGPSLDQPVSVAEAIEFRSSNEQLAHGFYYSPNNPKYKNDLPPPLIVLVHGGPTARAYCHFDIQKQFWTSHGFALFDVNHQGSSGYGREYRDALYGEWGELDTRDIVEGVSYLVEQGKANPEQICIRGKSAGGYAVLRALTEYPDIFRAGASYYGIGNLATLAEATHKFEKHYTDRLIGEEYNADLAQTKKSMFYQRSPINKIARINAAMIVYQGLEDKVVPPSVAHEVIDVLSEAGVQHEYVEYADEGHGFRQVSNNIDALGRELAFYRKVLSEAI